MKKLLILSLLFPFTGLADNIKTFHSRPYCFYEEENCIKLKKKFESTNIPNGRYLAKCVRRNHPDCPGRTWLLFVTIQVSLKQTLKE